MLTVKRSEHQNSLRRRTPARPRMPEPNSMAPLGSGTEVAAAPYPSHYQNEQEPFIENGGYIIAHAIRISRRAQLICKNLMHDRPTAQHGEHQNRVDWARDLGIAV